MDESCCEPHEAADYESEHRFKRINVPADVSSPSINLLMIYADTQMPFNISKLPTKEGKMLGMLQILTNYTSNILSSTRP